MSLRQEETEIEFQAAFDEIVKAESLNAGERATILREGKGLIKTMTTFGSSKLEIGKHLFNIQGILAPHGLFARFIQMLPMAQRTVYRYLNAYEFASNFLPETIVEEAIARGMHLLADNDNPGGIYTSVMKELPLPVKPTPAQARVYLDKIEARYKQQNTRSGRMMQRAQATKEHDRDYVMLEIFRAFDKRIDRIKPEDRLDFLKTLFGMMTNVAGFQHRAFAVEPIEIPEFMRPKRGRPSLKRNTKS